MCEWRIDPKDLPEGAAGLVVGEQGRLPGPGRPACPSKDPVPAGLRAQRGDLGAPALRYHGLRLRQHLLLQPPHINLLLERLA